MQKQELQQQELNQWNFLLHISQIIAGFLGPLIMWQIKKDVNSISEHGKEALNFQISMMIYSFIAGLLCLIFIGFLILPVLVIAYFVLPIIAGVKANNGEFWRYPLIIRLLK